MDIRHIDKDKITITLKNGKEFIFHETDEGLKVQTLNALLFIKRKGDEYHSATLDLVKKEKENGKLSWKI